MSEGTTQHLPNGDLKLILTRLDSIDSRLDSIDSRLDSVDSRFVALEGKVDRLEEKVDRRLQETRPIWEGVLEQLKEVNGRLVRVEEESKDFRRMFRSAFSDISRVQDDLEERLDRLDGRRIAP